MLRFGEPPYLECSSRGEKRLSAFYANPKSLKGRSIEQAYQGMKQFEDGTSGLDWRQAKGRRAVNQQECEAEYERWWREWVSEQNLLPLLRVVSGLQDTFGQEGHVCQAEVLWRIRNESFSSA